MAELTHNTVDSSNPYAVDMGKAKWGAALMRFNRAALNFDVVRDAYRACAKEDPRRDALGDLSDNACDVMTLAENDVFNTPAPNLDAVGWKLTYLRSFIADSVLDPSRIDVLLADVNHLLEVA